MKGGMKYAEEQVMVLQGRVRDGVVVLDEGFHLSEGQSVTVIARPSAIDAPSSKTVPHSILDIPTVSLCQVLQPLSNDDDLLGEMLEGRL